jgi:BNR/Asp-box repeat
MPSVHCEGDWPHVVCQPNQAADRRRSSRLLRRVIVLPVARGPSPPGDLGGKCRPVIGSGRARFIVLLAMANAFAQAPHGIPARFEHKSATIPNLPWNVSVIDAAHIWVGLSHTADGGRTWNAFSPPASTSAAFINNVPSELQPTKFITDLRGFLISSEALWRTNDGGDNWSRLFDGRASVIFATKTTGTASVLGRNDLQTQYVSHDAGETWQKCGETKLSEVLPSGTASFISETIGWSPVALFNEEHRPGRNGVARSDDGGCHWRLLSWYDDDRVAQVTFGDVHVGWLLPASPGPIARTLDGGIHWKHVGTPLSYFNPEGAYLRDRNHGWIFGSSPELRGDDSGMYFTSDLGDTWQSIRKSDLKLNRGLARDIPLGWDEGYFKKVIEQRK